MSGDDVRRRVTDDAIGTALVGLMTGAAAGMGIMGGQLREMTEPGRAQASQTVSAGSVLRHVDGVSPSIYAAATASLDELSEGLWLVQGRAQLVFASGQSGGVRARLQSETAVEVSDWYAGTVDETSTVIVQAHAWVYSSTGIQLTYEGYDMSAAALSGSATIDAYLIGTFA